MTAVRSLFSSCTEVHSQSRPWLQVVTVHPTTVALSSCDVITQNPRHVTRGSFSSSTGRRRALWPWPEKTFSSCCGEVCYGSVKRKSVRRLLKMWTSPSLNLSCSKPELIIKTSFRIIMYLCHSIGFHVEIELCNEKVREKKLYKQ